MLSPSLLPTPRKISANNADSRVGYTMVLGQLNLLEMRRLSYASGKAVRVSS